MTLSPQRWERVEEIVEAAWACPEPQRGEVLNAACGDDTELRRTVEKVLDSYGKVDDFLETPAAQGVGSGELHGQPASGGPEADGQPVRQHTLIGPYRVVRQIGQGGMSDVYLAASEDGGFRRQVAIKIVHGEAQGEHLMRRLKSERQILASLEHPGIAKLLDGGTMDDGRPYLVLEYIEGTPIDRYCDTHGLGIEERLGLVLKVCAAVQYAHQNLVVHRDIKPSNILVTRDGEPKLLDFGIAKLLNPGLFPHTVEQTLTDIRPMTPPYASPEQLMGQPVNTVSDVYSLGVLLYKLLVGRLPFAFSRLRPQELERMLSGEEAVKPSLAVRVALEPEDRDPPWGGGPQWSRRLRGDLDNIIAMALRREPRRRYASAEKLGDDLRLHLQGLPVLARKDTFGYRMGKFLRRQRIPVSLVGSITLLVVAFAVTAIFQGRQIAEERDRVALERDKARQVSDFMVGLFQVADPSEVRGNSVTVREVLDRGALKVGRELPDQPEIQATLMHTIGRVYGSLGLYDPAVDLLEEALDTRRSSGAADDREIAASAQELARLRIARGEYDEASAGARLAVQLYSQAVGLQHPETQASILLLGHVHRDLGEFEASTTQYQTILQQEPEADVAVRREALFGMATVSQFQGRHGEALSYYGRIEAMASGTPWGERQDIVRHGLGVLHRDLGQFEESRRHLEASYRARRRKLGPHHHLTVSSHLSLGRLALLEGKDEEAIEIFERSIENTRSFYNESSGDPLTLARLAAAYTDLASVLQLQGQTERAEALLRRSVDIMEPITERSRMVWFLDAHVRALLLLGRLDEARPMAEDLLRRGWVQFAFRDLCRRHGMVVEGSAGRHQAGS